MVVCAKRFRVFAIARLKIRVLVPVIGAMEMGM